ncbi:DcaP family trimeric outer membrane transporter [Flavobacterium terrisoli]|uniref:DcaP family trimeric outer membrane transporter n=1 Tax=Flavobacterium terrisoli TaxID=3242195 RepID=UPI002543D331|nr:DcaP family trimeric outer membrane transporter [Flavobacterium buctense]
MKKKLLLMFAIGSISGYAQTTPAPAATPAPATTPLKEWDVSMYGFIRTDYIWDTRRSAQVREYNLNLYPLDEQLDANGDDLNDAGASNFLSVVSRLGIKAKGPNVWGAKTNGTLEGDFFGNTEASIGLLRLRHAYVTLDWDKTSLLLGQTWYPTFIPEVFPGVANFSTGIMFNPFGWVSQARIKQNFTKELSFALTAYKEREFTTATATGGTQNSASFNSALPTLHGQFQFKNANWIAGLGFEYKSLQPLTVSNGVATSEKVNTTSIVGYFKYNNDKFHIKAYGISGKNLYNMVMLGGFAGYADPNGGVETYEGIKTTALWVDIAGNGKSIAPGLFLGYTKTDGVSKDNPTTLYGRGFAGTRGVDNVMRVAARVDFKQNKFRVTPELEYTGATWGDLKPDATFSGNDKKVGNFRAMISCCYSF